MMIRSVFAMIVLAWAAAPPAMAQSVPARALTVAAASDLQAALPEVIKAFERDAKATVTVSFGSSGSFVAQIQNGAPYDVYLSADIDYPRQLIARGLAEPSSLYQYATGRLVLWTRKDSGIDVTRGLAILKDARVKRIAIANPRFAPYGRAAEAALKREKVYDAVQGKIVMGDNISQTAQLADSGNADVGIIALSLAMGPTLQANGRSYEIPASMHPPIEQAAVVITTSKNTALARDLLAYLKRPEIAALLRRFGFATE